jgi:hypothetical protein
MYTFYLINSVEVISRETWKKEALLQFIWRICIDLRNHECRLCVYERIPLHHLMTTKDMLSGVTTLHHVICICPVHRV